jgi:hypothetical protein
LNVISFLPKVGEFGPALLDGGGITLTLSLETSEFYFIKGFTLVSAS